MRIDYDFLNKHFVQWSLYSSNKKPEISFKWSLVALHRRSLYREKVDIKTYGRTTKWSLRIGGGFIKGVVKTGLTVDDFPYISLKFKLWLLSQIKISSQHLPQILQIFQTKTLQNKINHVLSLAWENKHWWINRGKKKCSCNRYYQNNFAKEHWILQFIS